MIRCLGSFGIEAAGTELALPPLRPLPRTLLLLLALNQGRDVHREVLIDLLWPGTPLDAAAHRLHAAASSVRRCLAGAGLGGDVVRRHGSAYSLLVEGATSTWRSSRQHSGRRPGARRRATSEVRLAAWVKALEAYQGDLLGEAGPAEWVVGERDRLRVAAATAAFSAGQLSLRLRTPADALPLARRATELDPLRDSAWAMLADVQERMGDLGSAAATRREHALVASELAWSLSMPSVTIKALTPETFDDFAALVERNKGMFASCWCTKFHPACAEKGQSPRGTGRSSNVW